MSSLSNRATKGSSVMFRTLIRTWPVWMPLPIRLALGAIFIAHGSQKVLGKFNGPGLRAWSGATLAGGAENSLTKILSCC